MTLSRFRNIFNYTNAKDLQRARLNHDVSVNRWNAMVKYAKSHPQFDDYPMIEDDDDIVLVELG